MSLPVFRPIKFKNGKKEIVLPSTIKEFNLSKKDIDLINIHEKNYVQSNILSARKFS